MIKRWIGWYTEYASGMLTLETPGEALDMNMMSAPSTSPEPATAWADPEGTFSLASASRHEEAGGSRGVIDTGGAVSAGGQAAVQEMVRSLAKCRPDMAVTIIESEEAAEERDLVQCILQGAKQAVKARDAWFVEFDIANPDAFMAKNVLSLCEEGIRKCKSTEVRYDSLSEAHKLFFDEAKARKVSEVVQSMALRDI